MDSVSDLLDHPKYSIFYFFCSIHQKNEKLCKLASFVYNQFKFFLIKVLFFENSIVAKTSNKPLVDGESSSKTIEKQKKTQSVVVSFNVMTVWLRVTA